MVEKNQILIEDDFDFENREETLENFFGQPNSNLSDFIWNSKPKSIKNLTLHEIK